MALDYVCLDFWCEEHEYDFLWFCMRRGSKITSFISCQHDFRKSWKTCPWGVVSTSKLMFWIALCFLTFRLAEVCRQVFVRVYMSIHLSSVSASIVAAVHPVPEGYNIFSVSCGLPFKRFRIKKKKSELADEKIPVWVELPRNFLNIHFNNPASGEAHCWNTTFGENELPYNS